MRVFVTFLDVGAAAAERAAVIELAVDPEIITTRTTLSALRHQAEAQRAQADA